jgi:hypothetical protein
MHDDIPLGATGRFPEGKNRDDDEGELRYAVGPDRKGNVVVDFGKPTVWVAFPPADARALALVLLKHAAAIDGLTLTVVIGGPPGNTTGPR